jgi:hypothetical protein
MVGVPKVADAHEIGVSCGSCHDRPQRVRILPHAYADAGPAQVLNADMEALRRFDVGAYLLEAARGYSARSDAGAVPAPIAPGVLTLRIARANERYIGPFGAVVRNMVVPTAQGYAALQYILRDVTASVQHTIDLRLGVLLCTLSTTLNDATINVTDGYRTPSTNRALVTRMPDRAAQNSRHMYGDAFDGYVDGYSFETVFLAAAGCPFAGGLGLYNDHVHADTWHYRTW